MVRYLFGCEICGQTDTVSRSMADAQLPGPLCQCGAQMLRLYTAPYLTTAPRHLADENKLVMQDVDRRQAATDKKYDAMWGKPTPPVQSASSVSEYE